MHFTRTEGSLGAGPAPRHMESSRRSRNGHGERPFVGQGSRSRPAASRLRVRRELIIAECDQPPFDRVTMDDIAIASAALAASPRGFRVGGMQDAGAAALALADSSQCIDAMPELRWSAPAPGAVLTG